MELFKRFLDAATEGGGGDYGYQSDEVKTSPFNFGLNAGAAKMTKFEYIINGGKDGAEGEALDIVFSINGTDKNYRMFPVTQGFDKQGNAVTDRNSAEFKDALTDFNARLTHIMHAFVADEALKVATARPFKSFKEYVQFLAGLLPQDFASRPLDVFLQYQWQPSEGQSRTYLDLPKKMKYGAWLKPAQAGTWTEHRADNIQESTRKALWYVNEKEEEHPFTKNGWFMLSNFANQIKSDGAGDSNAGAASAMNSNATTGAATPPVSGAAPASAW